MDTKLCTKCKKIKPITEFYKKGGRNHTPHSYCKECGKLDVINRAQKIKHTAVLYKGGRCNICGYNKCESALDFHHINPEEKEFGIAHCHLISFNKIKPELDKCLCLCANCHRELHANLLSISDVKPEYCISIEPKEKEKETNKCIDCGKELFWRYSKRCISCNNKYRLQNSKTKIEWPKINVLIKMIEESNYLRVSKQLGVSSSAIKKHIKKYTNDTY